MARLLKEPPILRHWLERQPSSPFTIGELEVLRLNALGYTWAQVAEVMQCSVKASQVHWRNIAAKMEFVHDTGETSSYRLRAALWFQFNFWNESSLQ